MSAQSRQPASPGRRAAAYWFADGLPHIVLGITLFLIAAVGIALWRIFAPKSHVQSLHIAIIFAGNLAYWLTRSKIVEALKARLTYPRTGYAHPPETIENLNFDVMTELHLEPHRPPKENVASFDQRNGRVIYFAFVNSWDGAPQWFVPALITATAAALYVLNRNTVHPYRFWSATALALPGLPLLWVPVSPPVHAWLPLLLVGLWLTALGALKLLSYLRLNPRSHAPEVVRA